jgi:hypothetical protein
MFMARDAIHLFEKPLAQGWVYPCTLDDIRQRLAKLPEQDLVGLWAIGLVPSTRKQSESDGRYYFQKRPEINLYSYTDTLTFKLAPFTKRRDIDQVLRVQLHFGMQVEQLGSRYMCVWSKSTLRDFIIDHVLLHEVGHHVFFWSRMKQGLAYTPAVAGAESFADDYAIRNSMRR